jgi:hypothetical protein
MSISTVVYAFLLLSAAGAGESFAAGNNWRDNSRWIDHGGTAPPAGEFQPLEIGTRVGDENARSAAEMYSIGYGYTPEGGAKPPDFPLALKWIKKSADLGHGPTLRHMGTFYGLGNAVPKSERTAVRYYRQAVEKGDCGGGQAPVLEVNQANANHNS